MAFRRFRRRGGPRRAKKKVLWDRAFTPISFLALGTPTSQVIGDPTILPGSAIGFDQNRTLERIRLNCYAAFSSDLPAGLQVTGAFVCGVYAAQADSTVRDPVFAATDDFETDWLDFWFMPFRTDSTLGPTDNVVFSVGAAERDIRVRRKLTNDEVIVFVVNTFPATGAIAMDAGIIMLQQSLLWTATPT